MFFQFSCCWLQRFNFQIKSGFNKESHQDKSCKKTGSKEKRWKRRESSSKCAELWAALLPSGFPPRKMVMLPPSPSQSKRRRFRLSLNKSLLFLKGNIRQKHESSNIIFWLAHACFHLLKWNTRKKTKIDFKIIFFLHNAGKLFPDIKHSKIKVSFFRIFCFVMSSICL